MDIFGKLFDFDNDGEVSLTEEAMGLGMLMEYMDSSDDYEDDFNDGLDDDFDDDI